MNQRVHQLIPLLISAAGLCLWGVNFFADRPLFLDELNIARNLHDRTFAGLFRPLDYRQYAPPGWLVLAKACGEVFGYRELALRLPSALASLALPPLWWWLVGRLSVRGATRWVGLALLFANPTLLRYTAELKPYVLDLSLAVALLCLPVRRAFWWWLPVGLAVPWFSLPSVFVLAAVGLRGLYLRRTWRWPLTWLGWLVGFGMLYTLVLAPSVGESVLNDYHAAYFPTDLASLGANLYNLLRLAYGFTAYALLLGGVLTFMGGWVVSTAPAGRARVFILFPVILTLAYSALGLYSLLPRLMLFSLPCWWLPALLATQWIGERPLLQRHRYGKWLPVLAWLPVLLGTQVARHYYAPLLFSDARDLVTKIPHNVPVRAHPSAVPAVDYYQRIHPDYRRQNFPDNPGETIMLFDVLTDPRNRQALEDTRRNYLERGLAVTTDTLFRAARLRISPPVAKPNGRSGPSSRH